MSLRGLPRFPGLFATLLLVLPGPAAGQGGKLPPEKILAKDDAQFARELSRNGYTDLAEDVRNAMERSGGGAKSLEAAMLALEMEQDLADREPDVNKRIELLEGLLKSREEFARAHAASAEGIAIRDGQADLLRSIGVLITEVLREKTSADPEKLKKRGSELFEQAVTELEERLTKIGEEEKVEIEKSLGSDEAAAAAAAKRLEELAFDKMFSSYGLARTLYFRSLLYDPGSFERTVIARKAQKILVDFQLEYSDQLLCYDGYIYEGLSYKALDEFEEAIASFDAAIKLRTTYEQTSRGVYLMDPEAAGIVSSAVLQKMLLLAEQGKHAEAAACAQDFLDTTQEGWNTLRGLSVLSNLAEAYQALGDQKALMATAKTLIDVDPYGPGGRRGRELLGEGSASSLGAGETLKLAEQSITNDPDKAILLFQSAMQSARGTAEQDDVGARAGLFLGVIFFQRGWLHEAVVAWDGSADRYPKGKEAPECLWRAINGYMTLAGQENRPIYKTLVQERTNELVQRYPDHEYASQSGVLEGKQAEAEGDFVRAAQVYERIGPGLAGHEEALYRAGNAWSNQARKLFKEGKATDAKQAVQRAETLLVKARTALTDAAGKTLETSVQDRMRGYAFSCRIALANLYLMEGVGRAKEVTPLFDGLDAELANDPTRGSMVWDLRFRALNAQGKLDDAITLFETQYKRDPKAPWLVAGARILAPILDTRGTELFKQDPKSSAGAGMWNKAATYYRMAIAGQLEGREAVSIETLESVADRLFVFGLHAEGLPDKTESFVEWPKQLRSDLLETAARAYEAVLPLTPSYRTLIKRARTLGFLGRWDEAAAHYAELFEREQFVSNKTINQTVVAGKPELLFAYLEWGVCERQIGVEQKDPPRLTRAADIFGALVLGTVKASKLWWQSQFYLVRVMVDRGQYDVADVSLKSLQLNYEHFDDGQYGLEPRFVELRDEVASKVFRPK